MHCGHVRLRARAAQPGKHLVATKTRLLGGARHRRCMPRRERHRERRLAARKPIHRVAQFVPSDAHPWEVDRIVTAWGATLQTIAELPIRTVVSGPGYPPSFF